MADEAVVYELTSPYGAIEFNQGALHTFDDVYWIQNIQGLDTPTIRAPIDNRPQTHGGIVHPFFYGPRHITIEGVILVQSVPLGGYCLSVRNYMEEQLRLVLHYMLDSDGSLAWTPTGQTARTLYVRNEVPLDFSPAENYAIKAFTFGLVAADPYWDPGYLDPPVEP